MRVSVEIPVFKHRYLNEAIRSVLGQDFKESHLYLLSDGASWKARRVLRRWSGHPRISIASQENAGIGPARRSLSVWSSSEFILPMDDDDILLEGCLSEMVACMDAHPEAGLVRARRMFIDRKGRRVENEPWFPFTPRRMSHGMTCDVHNHSQPALIRRTSYDRTDGWFGFEGFGGAGEDCDIFLKIEEVGEIVLLDKVLYGYRLHRRRYSRALGSKSAREMWRRLADITIQRRGLGVTRVGHEPPFGYVRGR